MAGWTAQMGAKRKQRAVSRTTVFGEPQVKADVRNRHGRFREGDLLRRLFEPVVARCMAEGLVGGEAFAVDASLIVADAQRRHGVAQSRRSGSDVEPRLRLVENRRGRTSPPSANRVLQRYRPKAGIEPRG